MQHTIEAQLLLDSLNALSASLHGLAGARKAIVLEQMQAILDYFEERQYTMPIGQSITLGYYFVSDLSSK